MAVFPAEIGNLTYIDDLRLNENNLQGEIPKEIGALQRLSMLRLDRKPTNR